jgi:hypothetical protein
MMSKQLHRLKDVIIAGEDAIASGEVETYGTFLNYMTTHCSFLGLDQVGIDQLIKDAISAGLLIRC